jgi:tRNA(Ile)-lysidine synthase
LVFKWIAKRKKVIVVRTLTRQLLQLAPTKRWWVSYSGGLDSHVLLHSLKINLTEVDAIQLRAIHINHQLSPHATAWENHCLAVCSEMAIPLTVMKVDAKPLSGESPEEAARNARYKAISSVLTEDDCLITAHHCDDQAETLLLQLFRGAGLKGLSSMPRLSRLGQGYLIRPFLAMTRSELKQYAEKHALQWIEDESNNVIQFDRNYLRHEVFPLLKLRWPMISETLSRTAEICSQSNAMLNQSIRHELTQLQGTEINTLSRLQLKQLSDPYRSHLIREWIYQHGYRLPSRVKLHEIVRCVIESRYDANPLVSWGNVCVRRYGDDIYLLNADEMGGLTFMPPVMESIHWNLQQDLVLPHDRGVLRKQLVRGKGISAKMMENNSISVRFRKGGERFRWTGDNYSHSLKKLFQTWRVPPWIRAHIPLIVYQDKIIQVVGYGIAKAFAAEEDEEGYMISLEM